MSNERKSISINGFGRIGRSVTRLLAGHESLQIAHINDPMPLDQAAYLLRFDSAHGVYDRLPVETEASALLIGDMRIEYTQCETTQDFNWEQRGVDFVVNSSGRHNDRATLESHLQRGAKKIFVSAPAPGVADIHLLRGVNDSELSEGHKIISGGSCTAHCFAPVIQILASRFTLIRGYLQTVHAYTSSQNLIDGAHPSDPRRGRAAASNIVPTTTEAVKAFEAALPRYAGLLKGMAMRVPVVDGSNIDLVLQLDESPSREELNGLIQSACAERYQGIVEYSEDHLVSSDILGNSHSCIFDSLLTESHGPLVRLFLWYDNEWGYGNRLVELLELAATK